MTSIFLYLCAVSYNAHIPYVYVWLAMTSIFLCLCAISYDVHTSCLCAILAIISTKSDKQLRLMVTDYGDK